MSFPPLVKGVRVIKDRKVMQHLKDSRHHIYLSLVDTEGPWWSMDKIRSSFYFKFPIDHFGETM